MQTLVTLETFRNEENPDKSVFRTNHRDMFRMV
jgi:hypothetical protein